MPTTPEGDPAAALPRPRARVELELPLGTAPFDLEAAVCGHELFMMAPNRWDPASRALLRPLRLASDRSRSLLAPISRHPTRPSRSLLVSLLGADALSPLDQDCILEQVRRMLSEEDGRVVAEFPAMHAAAREAGFGRVFRSPTLFEDMVKSQVHPPLQLPMDKNIVDGYCVVPASVKVEMFIWELKRKRSKNQNVRVKLETKFTELECLDDQQQQQSLSRVEIVEDERVATDTSNVITHLETDGNLSSLPPVAPETGSGCQSFDSSELNLEGRIGDFPTPKELANLDENFLAKRCGLGYRAKRIMLLARSIVEGKVCLQNLEEMQKMSLPATKELSTIPSTYERLNNELTTISGFGPFTRANLLMCMGFFHMIPADTETIRHLKQCHKIASTMKSVHMELDKIYGEYAPFQFLAYWFELWGFYDKQFGKITEMDPSTYRLFTASALKKQHRAHRRDAEEPSCLRVTPYGDAGILSLATLSWLSPLLSDGAKRLLELADIPLLAHKDRAKFCYKAMSSHYERQRMRSPDKEPSLAWAILKSFWREAAINDAFAVVNTVVSYIGPYLISYFVDYLSGKIAFPHEGYILASVFFVSKLIETLTARQWYLGVDVMGIHVKSGLTAMVSRKGLRLLNASKQSHTSGEAHTEGGLNCEIALFGPSIYLQGLNQDVMVYH